MTKDLTEEQKEKYKKQLQSRSAALLKSNGWNSFLSLWWWEHGSSLLSATDLYFSTISSFKQQYEKNLLPLFGKERYQISTLGVALSNVGKISFDDKCIYKMPNSKREYFMLETFKNSFQYSFKNKFDFQNKITLLLNSDSWKLFVLIWKNMFNTKGVRLQTIEKMCLKFYELNNINLLPVIEGMSLLEVFETLILYGFNTNLTKLLPDDNLTYVQFQIIKTITSDDQPLYRLESGEITEEEENDEMYEGVTTLFADSMDNVVNVSEVIPKVIPDIRTVDVKDKTYFYKIDKTFYTFITSTFTKEIIPIISDDSEAIFDMIEILTGDTTEKWEKIRKNLEGADFLLHIIQFSHKKYLNENWVGGNTRAILLDTKKKSLPSILIVKHEIPEFEKLLETLP